QPFRTEAKFEKRKAGGVPARARKARDQAHADRVADVREHDGHGAGRMLQCLNAWGRRGQNHVRRERQKLLAISLKASGVARCPAGENPPTVAVSPAGLLKPLDKGHDARLSFRLVRGQIHQHANATHPLRLLRARGKRPRRERPRHRTTGQRDELAALHSITSSARSRNDSGIVRPTTLPALTFTTKSTFAPRSTP